MYLNDNLTDLHVSLFLFDTITKCWRKTFFWFFINFLMFSCLISVFRLCTYSFEKSFMNKSDFCCLIIIWQLYCQVFAKRWQISSQWETAFRSSASHRLLLQARVLLKITQPCDVQNFCLIRWFFKNTGSCLWNLLYCSHSTSHF